MLPDDEKRSSSLQLDLHKHIFCNLSVCVQSKDVSIIHIPKTVFSRHLLDSYCTTI